MEAASFHITHFGEQGLLVQVHQAPSEALLNWILRKKELLLELPDIEVVHTYNELLIKFLKHSQFNSRIEKTVKQLLEREETLSKRIQKIHKVPVCYEERCAVDMEPYARAVGLSVSKIIELHTEPRYLIYFLGFLPGFPYLEGLDTRLSLARKEAPSRKIAKGAVGIGGNQTGVYPQESPGGWHIIGQTPLSLFDVSQKEGSSLQAGDALQFYSICSKEFEHILRTQENE